MALPSQTIRPSARGNKVSHRRRRGGSKRWIGALVVLGVGALVIYAVTRKDLGPSTTSADDATAVAPGDDTPGGMGGDDGRTGGLPAPSSRDGDSDRAGSGSRDFFDLPTDPSDEFVASTGDTGGEKPATGGTGTIVKPSSTNTGTGVTTGNTPFARGMQLLEQGRAVEARKVLSRILVGDASMPEAQADIIRQKLTQMSKRLIFSNAVVAGDPLTGYHTVVSGDRMSLIAPKHGVTHQFLGAINGIDPDRIRLGQKIKIVEGPFHAVIHKSAYRMDVFLHDDEGDLIYICSLPVGLGEDGSTPPGSWRVKNREYNPGWTNPRTHKTYDRDDPENPIGEYWLGLEGTDETTKPLSGYGIHGTIDPGSIGRQRSMGCVRLADDDIKLVYMMLVEGKSTVRIVP